MDIRSIIKESLLREVGEATHIPFRYKRKRSDYINFYKSEREKDNFDYNFTTKEGFLYNVNIDRQFGKPSPWSTERITNDEWDFEMAHLYKHDRKLYVNLKKLGASREDLKSVWRVAFSILDGPENESVEVDDEYQAKVRLGVHGDVDLEQPVERDTYSPWRGPTMWDEPNKGEFYRVMSTIVKIIKQHIRKHGGKLLAFTPLDERRGRVFSQFVMKQIPGSKMWVGDNDFYFFLKNVK